MRKTDGEPETDYSVSARSTCCQGMYVVTRSATWHLLLVLLLLLVLPLLLHLVEDKSSSSA